jgi:hypothetical protein
VSFTKIKKVNNIQFYKTEKKIQKLIYKKMIDITVDDLSDFLILGKRIFKDKKIVGCNMYGFQIKEKDLVWKQEDGSPICKLVHAIKYLLVKQYSPNEYIFFLAVTKQFKPFDVGNIPKSLPPRPTQKELDDFQLALELDFIEYKSLKHIDDYVYKCV